MLKIKKLYYNTILPTKAHKGDAGWDLYSLEEMMISPGGRHKFKLGFAIIGERGKAYIVQGRSGLANNFGITTIGNVIDNQYRGEISAILLNTSNKKIHVKPGDKIAQLVIVNIDDDNILETVDEIENTDRGDKGFGSSG